MLYVCIGIRALKSNGVPALDGGFLQIMMATRGRTKMEKMVLADKVTTSAIRDSSGLSEKTLKTRVRYGKLIVSQDDGENETRVGRLVAFGTVDETIMLARRCLKDQKEGLLGLRS